MTELEVVDLEVPLKARETGFNDDQHIRSEAAKIAANLLMATPTPFGGRKPGEVGDIVELATWITYGVAPWHQMTVQAYERLNSPPQTVEVPSDFEKLDEKPDA